MENLEHDNNINERDLDTESSIRRSRNRRMQHGNRMKKHSGSTLIRTFIFAVLVLGSLWLVRYLLSIVTIQ